MRNNLLILCLLLAASVAASAFSREGATGRTIQTDGSQSDVQAAIDSAPDNGTATVTIPAGSFDWSGQLNVKKAITLAGSDHTIRNENGGSALIVARAGKGGNVVIYGIKFLQIADNGGGRGFCVDAGRD